MRVENQSREQLSAFKVSTALFLLSFGTVLFTVILFRLLTFFIMPSLFFDLLFIGFPIGALVGAYFFKINYGSFYKSLWLLQGTMVFSIFTMLACKHFDYLRAHLFNIELLQLFLQILIFTLFFLPFFVAYGLSEYIGYQIGRSAIKGKMYVVYALYLFGAALGYLFAEFFFSTFGVIPMMTIPFFCVAIAMLVLRPKPSVLLLIEPVLLIALIFAPKMEEVFLDVYKGTSMQSTHSYANIGFESVYQEWGTYSMIEIMQAPGNDEVYAGFYSDMFQWLYSPGYGYFQHGLGMFPLEAVPEGSSIAIIGSGGGRQVQYARTLDKEFKRILAIELEPGVIKAVKGDLADRFGNVYDGEKIELVNGEARGYMENTTERFDLIYLPSVGGYPQMMLEPGNMIRTSDAFETLSARLTDTGILAVWYPINLDPRGILTEQYMRTLESPEIGLAVRAFGSIDHVLILAANSEDVLPSLNDVGQFFFQEMRGNIRPPRKGSYPIQIEKRWEDTEFKPITDNQPFLAGNVQHIFSLQQVGRLFLLIGGVIALFAIVMFVLLGKKGRSHIPGKSFGQVVWISLLIGANFLIIEHYLILALFKKLYVYHDALVLGAISFLIISGLGSTFITGKHRPIFQIAGALLILVLLFTQDYLPPLVNLALLAPVAFVTGSFFPALFEAAAEKPLVVFAADAIGAALGLLVSFFVPIVLGFNWYFVIGTVVFWITAIATYRFFSTLAPAPESQVIEA